MPVSRHRGTREIEAGRAITASFACLAALVVAFLSGGCATSVPDDSTRDAAPLSVALARLRASGDGERVRPIVREPVATSRPLDAVRDAEPSRPYRGRGTLEPITPLYVPPSRRLPLQPILEGSRPAQGERGRPVPSHRDPLDRLDPLRRIDPVSGRDPLGRRDPAGGVGTAPARFPIGLGNGR